MSKNQNASEAPGANARPPVKMGATLGTTTVKAEPIAVTSQSIHVHPSGQVVETVYVQQVEPKVTFHTWTCDSCRKVNAPVRFQCMQCRVGNTYDLCGSCITQAAFIHPGHTMQQISSTISVSY